MKGARDQRDELGIGGAVDGSGRETHEEGAVAHTRESGSAGAWNHSNLEFGRASHASRMRFASG